MSFSTRLRYSAARTRQLRAPLIWLRHRGLDRNDVMLASYPRSGNTWTRFLLADLLAAGSSSFDNIQNLIPEMGAHARVRRLLPEGGRLIKTHEYYTAAYCRAVYVVRDVRDVLLSNFRRETLDDLVGPRTMDHYIRDFLDGKMTRFGSWMLHVNGWLDSPLASAGDLLVLRYEDLRIDVASALARVTDFLGVPAKPPAIQTAIRNNSIEKMRAKEDVSKRLRKSASEAGRWIRHGALGALTDWRGTFSDEQLALIHRAAGPTLARLGYPAEKSLNPASRPADLFPDTRSYRDWLASSASAPPRNASPLAKRLGGWVAETFSWYRY